MRKLLIPCLLLSSSCFAYRSAFDTVPSTGIPRASVSQIEAMIVEHDNGPDTLCPHAGLIHRRPRQRRFTKDRPHRYGQQARAHGGQVTQRSCGPKRLWIAPITTPDGSTVCGHYVVLPQERTSLGRR